MEYITFVEIENFKGFKDKVHIVLRNPSVLIGPNNAGKTTVIQSLSLWSRAVNTWYEKKGGKHKKLERYGVGINRLNILDIPVKESRFYWNGTKVRTGNEHIYFAITVGVYCDGKEKPLKMLFDSRDQESIYCRPDDKVIEDDRLFSVASKLLFNLLYPMSGIAAGASSDSDEFIINEGHIRVLIGQGRTAAVLRNLCYQVFSREKENWEKLCSIIKTIFQVELQNPKLEEMRGVLSLTYKQHGVENPLDIAVAGRGMQQTLLILAYLYSHKNSILMVDEPDAHLEILRQKQIFTILKRVSEQEQCQIIIATHSEVILDEAVDTNLTFLINGKANDLAQNSDIKATLKSLGVEHYYKASISPRLLIVEGSTDVDMLTAFAKKLNHPVVHYFDDRLFTFYTQDSDYSFSLQEELEHQAEAVPNFKNYFHTLKHLVPELRGIAILDGDNNQKKDDSNKDLGVFYWTRYELENYFITPDTLLRYIDTLSGEEESLFASYEHVSMEQAIHKALALYLFDGKEDDVGQYLEASSSIKELLLKNTKMSRFAEDVFLFYSEITKQPILMNKGDFYKIINVLEPEEVSDEIKEKLDLIFNYLKKN